MGGGNALPASNCLWGKRGKQPLMVDGCLTGHCWAWRLPAGCITATVVHTPVHPHKPAPAVQSGWNYGWVEAGAKGKETGLADYRRKMLSQEAAVLKSTPVLELQVSLILKRSVGQPQRLLQASLHRSRGLWDTCLSRAASTETHLVSSFKYLNQQHPVSTSRPVHGGGFLPQKRLTQVTAHGVLTGCS